MKALLTWSIGLGVLIAALGCSSQPPAPLVDDPEVLMGHWHELTKVMDRAELDFYTATVITERLAALGPNGLDPLFDVLGADDESPLTKLLALMCLQGHLEPEMEDRLVAFTAPEREQTTRTCATHLLGQLGTESALAHLQTLLDDENERVAHSAYLVLLQKRDAEALARADEFWASPTTMDSDREQFILILPAEAAPKHLSILRNGVTNFELAAAARLRAVELLAQMGETAEDLHALREAARITPEEALRVLAESAAAALSARLEAEQGVAEASGDLVPGPAELPPVDETPAERADEAPADASDDEPSAES